MAAIFSGLSWWWETAWCPSLTPIHGNVRALCSRPSCRLKTRVMSACQVSSSRIEQQPGVLVVGLGNADGPVRQGQRGVAGLDLGPLDAALDLAHRVHVLVDPRAVAGAEGAHEPRHVLPDRVQDAPVAPHLGPPLVHRAAVPEQPLEDRAGVVLHRQRGWSATTTTGCSRRRSCSRCRSCRRGSCSPGSARATAAGCRGTARAPQSGRRWSRAARRRPRSSWAAPRSASSRSSAYARRCRRCRCPARSCAPCW